MTKAQAHEIQHKLARIHSLAFSITIPRNLQPKGSANNLYKAGQIMEFVNEINEILKGEILID